MNAVELFGNPILDEVASFVANNKAVGPRFAALHAVLTERVIPARETYRAAVASAAKEKIAMESRHTDSLKHRESIIEQLRDLDRFVAYQMPAEIAAANAAPARIAEQANGSLTAEDLALVLTAIESFEKLGS